MATGGDVDWALVATGAGIPDEDAFMACVSLPPDSFPRIAEGKRIGVESGVRGTPTIWVNGVPTVKREFDALAEMLSEVALAPVVVRPRWRVILRAVTFNPEGR